LVLKRLGCGHERVLIAILKKRENTQGRTFNELRRQGGSCKNPSGKILGGNPSLLKEVSGTETR